MTADHPPTTEQKIEAAIRYAEHLAGRHARNDFTYPELNRDLRVDYDAILKLAARAAAADNLANALRRIDRGLTTLRGDNVVRGDAIKLGVRELAREALAAYAAARTGVS